MLLGPFPLRTAAMTTLSRRIHQHWSFLGLMYRLLDGGCIAAGLAFAAWWASMPLAALYLPGAIAVITYWMLAELGGMYRSWRGVSADREALGTLSIWLLSLSAVFGFQALADLGSLVPRNLLALWTFVTPVLILLCHAVLRSGQRALRAHGFNTRRFAIVGINELGFQLATNIEQSPEMGLRIAGFYDDRPDERVPEIPGGLKAKVGGIDDLVADAKAGFIDRIYITFPMRAEDRIRGVLQRLSDTTAGVYIVPDFFVFRLLHSRWTDIGGLPAVSVFENPLYGVDGVAKRVFDLLLGGLALLLFAAPMAVIALAIKLTSRGPVFFRQRRYGLNGEEIFVWKFRSMRVCENGAKVTQATQHDPRITPIGAILRRTSLDELPQLFNVLEGSMSLVGPRPHATAHNEQYRQLIEGYMLRHKIKPGITGLAQVNGCRGETDTLDKMQQRVEFDHQYIREWSLWLDLRILVQTVWVVLKQKNAY